MRNINQLEELVIAERRGNKIESQGHHEGDNVLEVGGHIGYVTQVFEDLVGDQGRVFVAEPTPKSRFYLKKNVRPNTKVLPIALADINGEMDFFTEKFGGFTNSLISDFTKKSNKS